MGDVKDTIQHIIEDLTKTVQNLKTEIDKQQADKDRLLFELQNTTIEEIETKNTLISALDKLEYYRGFIQ